jgi:hypothetical protein
MQVIQHIKISSRSQVNERKEIITYIDDPVIVILTTA